jgi:hypothetical protein
VNIDWRLEAANLRLIDSEGRPARTMRLVNGANVIDTDGLARGAYAIEVKANDGRPLYHSVVVLE